ncbi:hypothetical protein Q8A67_006384 [Cirrhinus molitorella]|uniref:Uncharacterized protein n=1 Tax=Cirrhinus molitorella TaxID=172907 RepID=A0AA88Q939_9TELE|nr:hypothetical protein Q8A67_006384 [Cirrhinus molitorella]
MHSFLQHTGAAASGRTQEVDGPHSGTAIHTATRLQQQTIANVFLADLVGGKWTPQKTVAIRFNEHEASVPGILAKVQDAVGGEEVLILTDGQGNEILDTEGTKGSTYWKQNSRKVFDVPEQQFLEIRSKKRRFSQRDDDSQPPEVLERTEEVVLASQDLPEVAQTIRRLKNVQQSRMHLLA